MTWADSNDVLRLARAHAPDAVELAALLSPAPRIETELVRAVRLDAAPELDSGVEGDLWFGPLVASRGAGALTLSDDVASILRQELAERWAGGDDAARQRLVTAREAMRRVHARASPALKLEERLAWLAVEGAPWEQLESELWSAVGALADPADDGVAHWAVAAWTRLPEPARASRAGWLLRRAAEARLGVVQMTADESAVGAVELSADLAALLVDLPSAPFGLAWTPTGLRLGVIDAAAVEIMVPALDPCWLDVRWIGDGEARRTRERVPLGQIREIEGPQGATAVRLTTAAGELYELERRDAIADVDAADARSGGLRPAPATTSRRAGVPGLDASNGFRGGPPEIYYLAWSANGRSLAAGGRDGTLVVWDARARDSPVRLAGHERAVLGLAWHPRNRRLASASDDGTVRLWDVDSREHTVIATLGVGAKGVEWSPDGSRLAVTDGEGGVGIWDAAARIRLRHARVHGKRVYRPSWSADGNTLVTAGMDGDVCVLSVPDLRVVSRMSAGSRERVWDSALSSDGACVACGHGDGAVRVWAVRESHEIAILEGHVSRVLCVAFSPDGRLLASATDGEIRLWRREDWTCVAVLRGGHLSGVGGLAFHPRQPVLVAKDTHDVDCWSVDFDRLDGAGIRGEGRRQLSAKVVLLGDTGVGKSGLASVLADEAYGPTDSTHAARVRIIAIPPADDHATQTREVLLWDLAGQPGYRLLHQLHLEEVTVALVVFDARSEADPFAGVRHWTRALEQARRLEGDGALPMRTFLVAARADRGGVAVTNQRVLALVDELGFAGFFETSAKEGWQIAELKDAMLAAIPWEELPMITSSALVDEMRRFVLDAKEDGRVLATVGDLFGEYCERASAAAEGRQARAEFEACMGRIERRGLIRRLRFGSFVLLQPEHLDAYASALVQAAKEEPDGLGFIAEEDALAARFRLGAAQGIAGRVQEKLLLIATVEELLRHEVSFRESTDRGVDLVFPSQFTRERPDASHIPGRELTLGFEGSLHNVYATLAVRLSRSQLFTRREMWRNAATFESVAGGVCGVYLREIEQGVGELDVFFDEVADEVVRRQFEAYVFEHVQQRTGAGAVTRHRVIACPTCRYVLPRDLVVHKLERGALSMRCPDCEEAMISLVADVDPATEMSALVTEMHSNANARRDRDVAATRIKGKVAIDDYDVFLCHNARDAAEVKAIGERLIERGIYPWLDEWSVAPGTRWQEGLAKQLGSIRAAAVFVGSRGLGPWQDRDIDSLLRRMATGDRPIIPVILESRKGNPRLPDFLTLWHLVDMRVPEPDPFEQLVWGITGERSGI